MVKRHASHTSTLVLVSATIIVFGCQRQDATVSDRAGAEAEPDVTRTAWVNDIRIANADEEPENWLTHGRTWSEQRYSPLNQINDSNIEGLGLAWYFDLDTSRGQQASPLIVDGVITA